MQPVYLPRLKAPRNHGELLVHPPLVAVGDLLRENRDRFVGGSLLGRPLAELRDLARRETLAAAHSYLAVAGEPIPDFPSTTWLVAGHQPELFHPGVWVKNFLLQSLARRHQATPLNLVVDNDVAKAASLRAPARDRVVAVPFDDGGGEVPFEERIVHDEPLFQSLPERIEPLTRDWPFRPWVNGVWDEMRRVAPTTRLLGERIVRTRRSLERSMGLTPLEAPLSAVCGTEAFAWFACSLLADLPRLVDSYNSAVREYRKRHNLKSKNHPVPDLAVLGTTLEAPFWVWRADAPRRQRLFAARDARGLQLFAGATPLAHLAGSPEQWIAAWPTLAQQGIKIRTRALTTTLFSRLLLADLFLHGIGGGKYDEVTDKILARYFDRTPPHYMVATATLLLPFPRRLDIDLRWQALTRDERDVWYNPQRHMTETTADLRVLLANKSRALTLPEDTHPERFVRFQSLLKATADLRPFISPRIEAIKNELRDVELERRYDAIAGSRDYSFCLYPEEMLRQFFAEPTSKSSSIQH